MHTLVKKVDLNQGMCVCICVCVCVCVCIKSKDTRDIDKFKKCFLGHISELI
jgi:hypothetical protein